MASLISFFYSIDRDSEAGGGRKVSWIGSGPARQRATGVGHRQAERNITGGGVGGGGFW
jgi:hypothetical protein